MIARAGAAESASQAGRRTGGWGELVRVLAGLGAEAALVGLDKPDTRSWTFLPGAIWIARARVAHGAHEVVVDLDGSGLPARRVPVEVAEGGYATVVVTEPR